MTELTCEARKKTTAIETTEQSIQFGTVTSKGKLIEQNIKAPGETLIFYVSVKKISEKHVFTITEQKNKKASFTYTQGSTPNDEGYFIDFKGRLNVELTLTFELKNNDYSFSPKAIKIKPVTPITETIIKNVITTKRNDDKSASITIKNTGALIELLKPFSEHPLADFTLNLVDHQGNKIEMDPRLGGIRI